MGRILGQEGGVAGGTSSNHVLARAKRSSVGSRPLTSLKVLEKHLPHAGARYPNGWTREMAGNKQVASMMVFPERI
jgi:hypothetical protein